MADDSTTAHRAAKEVETVRAEAALAGLELYALADGTFMLTRWNLTKTVANLQQVREFLRSFRGDR